MTNNRWWETYLVRYITGSVVGAVIVHFLLSKVGFNLIPDYGDIKTNNLLILSALGFAYCYISSAPISLLHAVRAMKLVSKTPVNKNNCKNKIANFYWEFFIIVFVSVIFGYFLIREDLFWSVAGALSMFALTLLYGFAIIKYKKSENNLEWQRWYMKLASKRSQNTERIDEYVQSYRHLREHGNAYLIIILEISFGIVIYSIETHICLYFSEIERQAWITILYSAFAYWIAAGAVCWHLGNKLEQFMVDGK